MPFVSDTFTGSAGTALASHTGEAGATWTYRSLGTSDPLPVLTDANRARSTQPDTVSGFYYASGVPATAEYDVVADFYWTGSSVPGSLGVAGRIQTGAATGYYAIHDAASSFWFLAKVVNGSFSNLGSFSQALTTGQTYTATLRIRDALKELYVAGVNGDAALIASADNAIAGAGRAGILFQGAFGDTTGLHIDTFSATDAANPVAAASIHARRRRTG